MSSAQTEALVQALAPHLADGGEEKARDAARKFRAALEAMGERIDARNAARPIPFRSFHPQCMDTSIAV